MLLFLQRILLQYLTSSKSKWWNILIAGSPKDTYKIDTVNDEEMEREIHMIYENPDKKVDIEMDKEVPGVPVLEQWEYQSSVLR